MPIETQRFPPRYEGPQQIGMGGMGEVYRAFDTSLGRTVAIKQLADRYAEDEACRKRFKREALAAARLSSEAGVVTIFDVGEWDRRPFIVMEHLAGGSLADRLAQSGRVLPAQALAWLEQAAGAIDAAHRQGVVHRDVKPANLLLDEAGNAYVADFGVASAVGADSLTVTGTVLGTAGYLSPEQARGERTTPASDRYALAVVAFELLTGRRPFESDVPTVEAAAHIHAPVPSAHARTPDLPYELDSVFERALAKDPAARYPSCIEFVHDLRAALDAAAGTTHRLPLSPLAPPRRRGRRGLVAAVGLTAAALAGGALAAQLLTRDGGEHAASPPPRTRVITVTGPATTLRETVSSPAPTPPPPTTPTPPPPTAAPSPASLGPHGLNDRAWSLMQQGDYVDALPLLQRALPGLQGVGPADPYEAYANYNLGYTLLKLGRCGEALAHLDRAERLEPHRPEVKVAQKAARRCA